MNSAYRTEALAEAVAARDAARLALAAAKTNKAARKADEDLDFWMGRVAFLQFAR